VPCMDLPASVKGDGRSHQHQHASNVIHRRTFLSVLPVVSTFSMLSERCREFDLSGGECLSSVE
jgi:hypothetical protein